MKRILTAALALLLAAAPLSAQKKAETKLYNKTLSKPSVAAFDKFLKKYPSSVYAEDILARKDTLLNISPYDMEQATAIAAPLLPEDTEFRAIADRREAVDRIDEGMKAAIEATLGPVWSQREDVRVRLRAAIVEKNQGAVEMLRGEYARLYGEESRLRREQLNERYKSLLAEVLTEAQMKLFSEEARTVGDTRKLYGPRQVTSQSIQYQTAGD